MKKPEYLTGLGQDSHRFVDEGEEKDLMLGGALIPGHLGLKGNSDADVILHAIFNAISQALGERSLGYYSDPICEKGITDSKEYLKVIFKIMQNRGYEVSNIGIMLECKTPKIEQNSQLIKESLSKILNLEPHLIGLTATSGEGLTDFGKGLGIQSFVTVMLKKSPTPFYKKPLFILSIIVILAYIFILKFVFSEMGL